MPNKKTIIVILGGGIKKESNHWRTTNFHEKGDKFGAVGDHWRVLAAHLLYHPETNQLFLVVGGRGQLENIPNTPYIANIIKQELITLGIPSKLIQTEIKSNNTYQQLLAIKKWQTKNKVNLIKIISNRYHLPRLRAFLKYAPGLFPWSSPPILLAAETIIRHQKPNLYKKELAYIYKSKSLKQRIALEKEGCIQIINKTYNYGKYSH